MVYNGNMKRASVYKPIFFSHFEILSPFRIIYVKLLHIQYENRKYLNGYQTPVAASIFF